ncbi:MAG: hypothetical protein ACRDSL_06015 [Pseudonocardiaceae bacterium]
MEGTYLVSRVRGGRRSVRRVRIGVPDRSLTAVAGMAAISEMVERLGVVALLDAAVGPIKQRAGGHGAGQLLVGLAAAQWAGEDHLVGLDRHRADRAGQVLTPVPGLGLTTAAGQAQRLSVGQWGRGGDRPGRGERADAGPVARGAGGGAEAGGDDRSGYHRY